MIRTDYAQLPKPVGIVCPKCGGAVTVLFTRRQSCRIARVRVCASAKCGARIRTIERVVSK